MVVLSVDSVVVAVSVDLEEAEEVPSEAEEQEEAGRELGNQGHSIKKGNNQMVITFFYALFEGQI